MPQDKLQVSWKVALDIWVRRFREAQAVIREMEQERGELARVLRNVAAADMSLEDKNAAVRQIADSLEERHAEFDSQPALG